MTDSISNKLNRRRFLGTGAALLGGLASPAIGQNSVFEPVPESDPAIQRNISSFRSLSWQPYFSNTNGGAILVDTTSRALHYWSADQTIYKLYPTSVPISEEMTRRGRTSVTRKVEGPSWAPTPSMKKRNPEWPDFVPPGPDNPLGTHALYLGWKYYRIHGTHDTRKIGRRSSNGCIGLYNEHISELFALVSPGAQVLLI
ncbi:L,D-transpeptidase [Aliiruegeria lutimaris]|uniref:L,D-transpeptidase catalytic domain n=1 Tax=Aliiruegeria lutimaris TaxID=571298 RepID=A0A1G8NFB7_9RHOB|nr:L,D-transpeptidase family protein [Aliiruegeria lutimaris]SDI78822.1 L,D-transpeptidase catalytic domain [Aliiruegeria lutimaris]